MNIGAQWAYSRKRVSHGRIVPMREQDFELHVKVVARLHVLEVFSC